MNLPENPLNETSRSSAQDWLGGARWPNIIELLPAAVYVCDAPSGIITYYNPRAAQLWGRAPAVGDTDDRFCGTFRLYRPDGSPLPHDQTPMAQVLGGAPPARNQEIVIERPDGSRITVAVNIDPIKNADGKTVGAINVFQDVSQEKRLSEALQQSEERLRLATQTGKLGIWDWDIVANRVSWSQSLYAIHGVSPDRFDATVDAFAALVHPDDRERVSRAIQKAIADDAPYELEFRILRPDGKIVWVFTNATVMRLGGRAVRMIGATMDITERKNGEVALRQSERVYRGIGDSIPYGIWIGDDAGRNVYTSEAFLKLVGLTQEQCADFGWTAALHPDDAAETLASWQECARTGAALEREHRFKGVDGQWHPVLARGVPIKDEAGNVTAWVGINLDIGNRVRTRALARQQAEMLEQTHDAIFQFELYGGIVYWTRGAEKLYGFSRDEVLGRVVAELLRTDCVGGIQAVKAALERDGHWSGELTHTTRDGREVIVESRMLLWRQADGTPVVIEANHDITDRKQMERALRESEQMLRVQARELEQQLIASDRLVALGEVTASMAHELNNPLGIIIGFIEDMLSGKKPSDPDFRALRIIDEESQRCKKIIADLMEYARPRSAEMSSTDVPVLIEKTLNLVENHLYKQKIEAAKELAADLPKIHADSQQLAQVLVNLFLNAIDAMPQGGRLKVVAKTVKESKQPIVIEVADSGHGIEGSELAKIFKPFYTAKKRRGLGLGLPICERIIKNHGGRLEVDSVLNHGTTFRIYLPLRQEATKG